MRKLLLCLLILGLGTSVYAQGLPSKKEIDAKVQEGLKSLPDKTEELEGVCKFTYKEVPSSPEEIVKLAAGKSLPQGIDPKMAVNMYKPVIAQAFQRNLAVAGKLEVTKPIKIGSKKIPAGEHKFGYAFKGMQIVAVLLYPKGKKRAIKLPLKTKVAKDQYHDKLQIKIVPDKSKKSRFALSINFFTQTSLSKKISS